MAAGRLLTRKCLAHDADNTEDDDEHEQTEHDDAYKIIRLAAHEITPPVSPLLG